MGTIARTWELMGASWRMLKQDKALVVFPLVSAVALAILVALFAVPLFIELGGHASASAPVQMTPRAYFALFVFYFLAYFVIIFFNSALIACVMKRIDGDQPTLGFGIAYAWQRLPQICGWALLASSVGMLLRMIEERVGFVGRIVVALLGMAWTVTSFLVVPVLVVEGTGPIESYKRSVSMLKRTWGEQIVGNVGFGLLFGLFGVVPAVIVIFFTAQMGIVVFIASLAVLAVWLLLLGLVQSTLQTIYQAAIYCYAATGEAPKGFDNQLVAEAFKQKQSRSWL